MTSSDLIKPIVRGRCHALHAFEVGQRVDLDAARLLLGAAAKSAAIRHQRPAPAYFQITPAPLVVTQDLVPLRLGAFNTNASLDLKLYDFGAISATYVVPFAGPLGDLVELSALLVERKDLSDDAERRVTRLLELVRPAVEKLTLAAPREEYAVFQVEAWEPGVDLAGLVSQHGPVLARVLRAERGALGAQEIGEAMLGEVSYGPDDRAFVDWSAALLFDRDAGDVLSVLEFANVQLLEMRLLDGQLDRHLDRAYDLLVSPPWRGPRVPGSPEADWRRVGRMQVDGAILYERVTNALKLVGDQYLARVYRQAAQRFHLGEWNAGILRKLETIEGIYRQLADRAASRRLEVLEWVIIALIAFEVLWGIYSR